MIISSSKEYGSQVLKTLPLGRYGSGVSPSERGGPAASRPRRDLLAYKLCNGIVLFLSVSVYAVAAHRTEPSTKVFQITVGSERLVLSLPSTQLLILVE